MRFADCIDIYRADCGGGYGEDGSYIRSMRKMVDPCQKGLITNKRIRTTQSVAGEQLEGSFNFRISGRVYSTNEDDIGDADIIFYESQFWRVTAANPEGCDTVGTAILLSDDACVDLGIDRC